MADSKIEFRFVGIQIINKSMMEMPVGFPSLPIFGFSIQVQTKVQAVNKLVMPFVSVVIHETSIPIELAKFDISCLFEVSNFENVIKLDEKGFYIVPNEIESVIRPVSISTVRGVIFSELRGTYMHTAIMPIVYMDNFKQIDNNPPIAENRTTPKVSIRKKGKTI